ncbi:PBSX family phage terminase large subunit [Qipengyuania sp. DGS5-3]|uniref:PBSX family phage terminase large subunit n=1 Tax=Qipengyuania sp. DGS5-3 TaxID=3349632 RepID=UPI0036D2D7BE
MTEASFPEWAVWLDVPRNKCGEPVRHRVLYGGRGGGKSWTIAQKLVILARQHPLRILCTREFQNSIRDSSKKLIEQSIERMGLGSFFKCTEREIIGRNGSQISFMGLNGKEASIKSLEGYDLAWVEEATTLSQSSINALIPTIRKEGSEIWWSFNPRYPSDPVDALFRGQLPPPGSIVLEIQWRDNPWFPQVLRRDMEYDRIRDPEKHANIWEGKYLQRSEAQVFHNWQISPFDAPDDADFRFGADWGFSKDPTVLVRCFTGSWVPRSDGTISAAYDPAGKVLFIDHEAYAIGCPIDEIPALFAGSDVRRPPRWHNPSSSPGIEGAARAKITADSARPETIDYLAKRGFIIEGAAKGPGSIEEGIEFLKSYDIIVHPRCQHLVDELIHYSWAIDRQTGEIRNVLADKHNHVIDALRYAVEGAHRARKNGFEYASSGPRVSAHPFLDAYSVGGGGWGSYGGRRSGILPDPWSGPDF